MATNALGREEVRAYLRVTDLCEDVVCSAGEVCKADYLTGKCTLYSVYYTIVPTQDDKNVR